MSTTPPFVPGQIPGISTAVPGITPQQPPIAPQTGDPTEKAKQILATILQAAGRKQMANTAVPTPVPGREDPAAARNIGMNTSWPGAWSTQRFLGGLATNIKNAVVKQKEGQLLKAEGDWTYLQSSMNELFEAQQSGDPNAIQAAQKKVDVILGDPKKLKNMAKALNQDWLNPEKTTVYGEALKKVAARGQQTDAQNQKKQQAATGLKALFQHLIGKSQQPELTDEQKTAMAREIQEKVPTTPGVLNIESLKSVSEFERAIAQAREKYQYVPSADGTIWAVNKSDPKDAHQLKDAETGSAIHGKAPAKEGQPVMANGMPIGVFHNGQPVMPGDPTWSEKDQKIFDASVGAAKEKQFLKLDPVISAQLGEPPNPADYAKGRSSPEYAKALREYGQEAEKIKNRMAAAGGAARAMVWNEYRPVQALDADGNVIWTYAKNAIGGGMAPAGIGTQLMSAQKQIEDIEVASDKFKDAIKSVDKPFTPDQVAKLTLATRSGDEELVRTALNTVAMQNLTDKQQDFVVWMAQVNERAMSLRKIAGQGQGAEDLRNAIRQTIASVQSGSKEMMMKQIGAFDNQVAILKTGIAHPGKKSAAPAGTVTFKEGITTYHIPKAEVPEFKKDKPNAVQVQ